MHFKQEVVARMFFNVARSVWPLVLAAAMPVAAQTPPPAAGNRDAVHLARTLGISVEDAEARMRMADRLGIFQIRVRSDPDFAGAYLEHEPKLQAVVLFKGDAAEKLKRYVGDDAFVARGVDYSLGELAAAEAEIAKAFKDAGLAVLGIEKDIEANRVLVHLVDDAPARAAIAAEKLMLPKAAQLDVAEDDFAAAPQSVGTVTAFPQARYPAAAEMRALMTGKLFERDGCLRVGEEAGESLLVLWPSSARLVQKAGAIAVRDGEAGGEVVVGTDVSLGGGNAELPPPGWLIAPVPQTCAGPYWIAARGW